MISLVKGYPTALYILGTALIASFPTSAVRADTLIVADDPRINYYGRFDFTNPSSPRWNWSSSIIEACFSGPSIGIGLVDGKSDYDIEIDGVIDTVIRTKDNIERYDVGSFSDTLHVIRIVQRSENHTSAATLKDSSSRTVKHWGARRPNPPVKSNSLGIQISSLMAWKAIQTPAQTANSVPIRTRTVRQNYELSLENSSSVLQ